MDTATWEQLRSGLDAALAAWSSGKSSSALPNQAKNGVTDAQVVDDGSGGFNLAWSYRNAGDYDQNGEVNISDLTPLGIHIGASSSSPDWATARAADGDGNGLVSISDMTPIGANFFAAVEGYNIYGGASAAGPWTFVAGVPLQMATSTFPRSFTVPLSAAPAYPFYALTPYAPGEGDWISGSDVPHPAGAAVQLGNDVPDQSTTLPAGTAGTLTGSAGTPLAGYSVSVPATAFDIDTQVSLGYNDGTVTPLVGTQLGPIIHLSCDYGIEFQDAVDITVPYSGDPNDIPVPFYIDPDLGLRVCNVVSLDPAAKTMTFQTRHASDFTTLVVNIVNTHGPEFFQSGFDPKLNGFQVENGGSKYNLRGEGFGMTTFAAWFYGAYHSESLYKKYMTKIGGSNLVGQSIIATRALNSIAQNRQQILDEFIWQGTNLSDEAEWAVIRMALVNSGAPVVLAPFDEGSGHYSSVLALGYANDELFVYDPNFPGALQAANFDGTRLQYGDYGKIYMVGEGSLLASEPFENIKSDADNNFAGSPDTVIALGGVADGQTVTTPRVTITPDINSGQVLIDQLAIFNDNFGKLVDVTPSGDTELIALPLESGDNYFQLLTTGLNSRGERISVSNNFSNGPGLHIIGGFGPPVITLKIAPLPADGSHGTYTTGSFELWIRYENADHTFKMFQGNAPEVLPNGTGLVDDQEFIISSMDMADNENASLFHWFVHRHDPVAMKHAGYSTELVDNRPKANPHRHFWTYGANDMDTDLYSGSAVETDPWVASNNNTLDHDSWSGPWASWNWLGFPWEL